MNAVPVAGAKRRNRTPTTSSSGASDVSRAPSKKSAHGDLPGARGRLRLDHPVGEGQDRRHLAGSIGVRDRADGGAAVADDGMGDVDHRLAQQRQRGIRLVVVLELGVAHERAHPHLGVGHGHLGEAGDLVDVDEVGRRGESHVEDRDEALPTREDLAVVPHLAPAPRPPPRRCEGRGARRGRASRTDPAFSARWGLGPERNGGPPRSPGGPPSRGQRRSSSW